MDDEHVKDDSARVRTQQLFQRGVVLRIAQHLVQPLANIIRRSGPDDVRVSASSPRIEENDARCLWRVVHRVEIEQGSARPADARSSLALSLWPAGGEAQQGAEQVERA